jgi:hypothetical protein
VWPAATCVRRTLATWSSRAVCACGGALAGSSAVARRWQGVAGEHRWGPGEASGKKSGDGAHRDGRATVGQRKAADAPVVVDVRGRVLQHWCGRGKRDLAPIRGMTKLRGRSPKRGKTSAVLGKIRREGEVSSGPRRRYGRENGGEGGGAREGGRSGVGDEGVDE